MEPLVSVIVPTYRREESLVRALDSLADQTYKNLQIVLVDDNGHRQWNQRVRGVVSAFTRANPTLWLKHLENPANQGSAGARNRGIEACDGEYVTFLDDDDLYLPDKVSQQVRFMQAGGYDYCLTDLFLYNESGALIGRRIRSYLRDFSQPALRRCHLLYHLTGTGTIMFSKSYLMQIGCFAPIDVGDDYYLIQRAIDGGGSFGYLPGCGMRAYVHTGDGGLSSGDGKIKGENALYAYKKQFFHRVSAKDRRYITMRHYAVLAFAEIRRGRFFSFVRYAVLSCFSAPLQGLGSLGKLARRGK